MVANNNGSLIYTVDDLFGKIKISVKYNNINNFVSKGVSSVGNSFYTVSDACRKSLQIDLNGYRSTEYSLEKTVFMNGFEQRLLIQRMERYYKKLHDNANLIYRRNIIDGIEQFEIVEQEIRNNRVCEIINFSSGKNIELIPATDIDKTGLSFCGTLFAVNQRRAFLILTIDEFEYFISKMKKIDMDSLLQTLMQTIYLSELSNKINVINKSAQRYNIEKPDEYPEEKPFIQPLPNKKILPF